LGKRKEIRNSAASASAGRTARNVMGDRDAGDRDGPAAVAQESVIGALVS
jgi:hypothetical protein